MNLSKRQLNRLTFIILSIYTALIVVAIHHNFSNKNYIKTQDKLLKLERENGEYLERKVEELENNFLSSLEARNSNLPNIQLNQLESNNLSKMTKLIDKVKIIFFVSKNVCSSCRTEVINFILELQTKIEPNDILLITDYSQIREWKALNLNKYLEIQYLNLSESADMPLYFSNKPTFIVLNQELRVLEYLKFNNLDSSNLILINNMIYKHFITI